MERESTGFFVRSCLAVNLDSGHRCAETAFITLEISRATPGSSALLHYDRVNRKCMSPGGEHRNAYISRSSPCAISTYFSRQHSHESVLIGLARTGRTEIALHSMARRCLPLRV
jgi:hypothetical protein